MSTVLTTGANVTCGHPLGIVALKSSVILTVGKGANPVLTATSLDQATVSGCQTPKDPNHGNMPCGLVTAVGDGKSATLKVNGESVILSSLTGTTDGKVTGTPQDLLKGTDPSSPLQVKKATP
jgi:hypothetical protein